LRALRRFGRTIKRRWSGYQRRSRVEICGGSEIDPGDRFPDDWMPCVKPLGQRLMANDFDRQVAEFQIPVAVLNGFTALGIPVTQALG
jgi:hypothetical protein